MKRFENKVGIVTGGASGIGKAIADRLQQEGASVVITDIDSQQGELTAEALGASVVFMALDVSNETQWQQVYADTLARFKRIDILVNNAGIGGPAVVPEKVELTEWQRVQKVNLEGTFLGCKTCLPALREAGRGVIVNISSVAAFVPTANDLVYGASKAGVRQLTQSLALHYAKNRSNVRINSVHPGVITTEGVMRRRSAEVLAQIESSIPMGCVGDADDVANAVLFLAGDEAKYITGTSLIVDGGYTLSPIAAVIKDE